MENGISLTDVTNHVQGKWMQYRKLSPGRLAQLVQSTCLTSRGSLVRIQYRPRLIEKELGFKDLAPFFVGLNWG